MAQDNFSTREVVVNKLLEQLEVSNQSEKKRLLMKLFEHIEPTYIEALDFAYSMIPRAKPTKE